MVVDDHPAFRMGLIALVESQPDMEIVAETGDGREALAIFQQKKPDIVLTDLRMPGISGVEVILAIRNKFPEARIIVVTTYDADEDIYRAIQSAAKSYLLKDMSKDEIVRTIRAGASRRTGVAAQHRPPAHGALAAGGIDRAGNRRAQTAHPGPQQ